MKRREKYLLLKQKMREDKDVRNIQFEEEGLEITLVTNRQSVIANRKTIANIIMENKNDSTCEEIADALYNHFSKNALRKIKVRVKMKEKKKWEVMIKYRKA